MATFADSIVNLVYEHQRKRNDRLQQKVKEVLTESISFYEGLLDKLRRMNAAILSEDYEQARVEHEALMAEHNRSITIVSGPNWEDVRVSVIRASLKVGEHIELPDDEFVFRKVEAPEEQEAPTLTDSEKLTEPSPPIETTYMITPIDTMFSNEGWGLFAGTELVAVIKGQARAEFMLEMLEYNCGAGMLAEWTRVFQEELAKDNDYERASNVADEVFAKRLVNDAN